METPTPVNTVAESIHFKSDIAQSKVPVGGLSTPGSKVGLKDKAKKPLEEYTRKHQRQEIQPSLDRGSEGETLQQQHARD